MVSRLIVPVLVVLTLAHIAAAAEYPCPSDPGFCYFDVGNDGCFDAGTDTGPIDSQLESGEFPTPLPPGTDLPTDPGSIICPPSVRRLRIDNGCDYRTAIGGDIRIHSAQLLCGKGPTVCSENIEMRSGGQIQLGGFIDVKNPGAGRKFIFEAEDEIFFGKGFSALYFFNAFVTSKSATIELAPKVRLRTSQLFFDAATDLLVGDKVRIESRDSNNGSTFEAGGQIVMSRPQLRVVRGATFEGSDVSVSGLLKVRRLPFSSGSAQVRFEAIAGDVTIERIKMSVNKKTSLTLVGDSVTLGGEKKSKIRLRADALNSVTINAADRVTLRALDATVDTMTLTTTGTEVDILDSRFRDSTKPGTMTIASGLGSTCDFTGTSFEMTTFSDDCDTVVGP